MSPRLGRLGNHSLRFTTLNIVTITIFFDFNFIFLFAFFVTDSALRVFGTAKTQGQQTKNLKHLVGLFAFSGLLLWLYFIYYGYISVFDSS